MRRRHTMRIAIIGGIGSGKSEVLAVAKELGFATLSADKINSELLDTPSYIEKIRQNFPLVVDNGEVNRAKLAAEIFSSDEKRELLNSISHPEIKRKIDECAEDPLVVELPLALEGGMIDCFDQVILVDSSKKSRYLRLESRGIEKQRARKIMRAQAPRRKLQQAATCTIFNNGNLEHLRESATQVLRLLGE